MPEPTTPAAEVAAPPPPAAVIAPEPVASTPALAGEPTSVVAQAAVEAPETPAPAAPVGIELKLPEGFTADAPVLEAFKKNAAEIGLDSAKAQKLFDQYVQIEQSRADAAAKSFVEQDAKWAAELKADPDIGGEKLQETTIQVRKALKYLGGGEVAKALMQAGLGNHPTLVRAFAKLGRGLSEDSVSGSSPAAGTKPPAAQLHELLYPTMQKTKTKE